MQIWTAEEVERTLEAVRKLSIADSGFRQLALEDPAAAVATVNAHPLPEGYRIKFVDNSGPVKTFLLPDPVPNVDELSDAELESVAGGVNRNNNVNVPVVPAA